MVKSEREHYSKVCAESKETIKKIQMTGSPVPSIVPSTGVIHYSFDFAQQIHYPHDPFQPGPMYFLKAPRKCSILVCAVRGFCSSTTTSLMRLSTVEKGKTVYNNIVLQVSCQKKLNSHEQATLIFFFPYLI